MNGIKMSDCRFYINEQARTIICVIPNTQYMLRDFIYQHFQFKDVDIWEATNWSMINKIAMPYSFMGKAVCAPGDEWNEELGRMIAFSRAKDKCYKSFFRRANMLIQTVDKRLNDMITMFNDFGMRLEAKHEALQAQIDERINKEE